MSIPYHGQAPATPRYTHTAMLLHWLLGIALVTLFGVGLYMADLPFSPQRLKLYNWHKWAGVSLLALSLLRLVWRLVHRPPQLPERVQEAMPRWQQRMAACKGKPVVTYHKNWRYFMERFGVREFQTLEPKPGIPPSPGHINRLIQSMKREGVKAMVVETIYPKRFPEFVARETGARLEWAPYSIGVMGTRDYIGFVDKIVEAFHNACR